jgi:predicted nucleic-acid-binding Zn-ribbon protein
VKATQTCPKCAGKKFAVTTEFRQPGGADNDAQRLPAITLVDPDRGSGIKDRITSGRFETWSCVRCGYTEFYAYWPIDLLYRSDDLETLAKQHPDQLRIVDAGPPEKGPYR